MWDVVLEVLRTSNDNDERRRATARLRQMQESDPAAFLHFTWDTVSSSSVDTNLRFFIASTVVEFVEQSWQSSVPKDLQEATVTRYLQLLLCSEPLPSLMLTRKVALALGLMLKRCNLRSVSGALPQSLDEAVKMIGESVVRAVGDLNPTTIDQATQYLVVLHLLLKVMEGKRMGGIFPQLCASLIPVMSKIFVPSASLDYVTFYTPLLYMLKCALRVFGAGVFVAEFYPHLLNITWQLALFVSSPGHSEEQLRRGQRLMEYAVKIQLKMVNVFPSRLNGLSSSFFISQENNDGEDRSLFGLLVAIIESPCDSVVTEKLICRALLLLEAFLVAEDICPFVSNCVATLADATSLLNRILKRVVYFLADETDDAVLGSWDLYPERHADELERLTDDTGCISSCSEGLLLVLTGSTYCSRSSLHVTWNVVNALLEGGGVSEVTAALHVIGVCCHTMAEGWGSTNFMDFLNTKLLRIVTNGAAVGGDINHRPSPFILRRVVWVIGMWCESVTDSATRREVYRALTSLLRPSTHVVLQLCALKSIGHFILDSSFESQDVSIECVHNILVSVQSLLPQLSTPSTIEHVAGLVHCMIVRGLLPVGNGELLLDMILPAVYRAISDAQGAFGRCSSVADVSNGDEDNVDGGPSHVRCVGMLLECVSSCVSIAAPELEERVWSLFNTVVVPCTKSGSSLSAWADEQAWELLLCMSCAARLWLPSTNDALLFALENMTREISSRHVVVRCVYCILLLCPHPERHISTALVDHAVVELTQTCRADVARAYFALLAVMLRLGEVDLRCHLVSLVLHRFLSIESVQSETFSEQLALLLAWSLLPCSGSENCEVSLLDAMVHVLYEHPNATSFVEWIVLLFDVSSSTLVTEQLVHLLQTLLNSRHALLLQFIGGSDRNMAQRAIEGTLLPTPPDLEQSPGNGEAETWMRNPQELFLELFGDTTLTSVSPHVMRLHALFDICARS